MVYVLMEILENNIYENQKQYLVKIVCFCRQSHFDVFTRSIIKSTYCRKLEVFQSFPQVSFGHTWCKFVHPSNIGLEPNQILLSNVF